MKIAFRETGDQPGSRPTYKQIIASDRVPAPAFLIADSVPDLGTDPVSATNYTCPEFFRKEVEKVWLKCWQMACREEEIPNVGDYLLYEVAGHSLIVVRSAPEEIKALYNVCLHRGRKLETHAGCKRRFRCTFHGWEWNVDGSFRHNPWAWDFPQLEAAQLALPEARVGRWGGFVFVSFADDPPPLMEVLAPIPEHFADYHFEDRYIAVHVAKRYPANWKATAEAFMESHHSIATHPQFMPYLADVNSGYDVFSDYTSRQLTAMAVPSPFIDSTGLSQSEILDAMLGSSGRVSAEESRSTVPPGMSARGFAAEEKRKALAAEDGYDYAAASDAEMLDPMLYNVFPNMSFWAGYAPNIVYRWRPDGVDAAIMDIYILKRVPKGSRRPRPAAVHWLEDSEPFSAAAELGALGGVFDQDMANLPFVQEGLKMMGKRIPVQFAKYTEIRLRQLHRTLQQHIDA
jgi:phenylpropionate dioxygenase-like ring-hydroxylating dioxygenase large terminal subunit